VKTLKVSPFSSLKNYLDAIALTDPVLLHRDHAFRPILQSSQVIQKAVAVGGDLEIPLFQLFLDDRRMAAPAAAVDDLLIGQGRLATGAPVDAGGLLVRQAAFQHLQKNPLVPAVIFRQAGRDFPLPVIGKSHAQEFLFHPIDAFERPCLWVRLVFDGGVLGRLAEGVESHGMQDAETLQDLVTGHNVADGIIAHMPHVDTPRRIRKHLQDVILRLGLIRDGPVELFLGPNLLPLVFQIFEIVVHVLYRFRR